MCARQKQIRYCLGGLSILFLQGSFIAVQFVDKVF